jgi:hypothetical protein
MCDLPCFPVENFASGSVFIIYKYLLYPGVQR